MLLINKGEGGGFSFANATLEKKLGNADFIARAPEDVIAEQRGRLIDEQSRKQRLVDALAILGDKS